MLVLIVVDLSIATGQSPPPRSASRPAPAPVPTTRPWSRDLDDLEKRLEGSIGRNIARAMDEGLKSTSSEGRQLHERTDLLIKYVSWVSSAFLGVVSLIIGVFLALGWRELRLVTGAREAVAAAKTEVDRANADAVAA